MLEFRKANPGDAPEINEIIHRAFKLYADELSPDSHVKALEEPNSVVLQDISDHCVIVAEDGGKILGSIRVKELSADLAYVYRFGVDPTIRNAGVGSGLLQSAIDYCNQNGYCAIALHTNAKYYKLARYYYGKKFYVHSTSTEKGYIRALFIKDLNTKVIDFSPAFSE